MLPVYRGQWHPGGKVINTQEGQGTFIWLWGWRNKAKIAIIKTAMGHLVTYSEYILKPRMGNILDTIVQLLKLICMYIWTSFAIYIFDISRFLISIECICDSIFILATCYPHLQIAAMWNTHNKCTTLCIIDIKRVICYIASVFIYIK